MVLRPPADRKLLELQNAESATVRILSFVAKCHAEMKEDMINTVGTILDLQVTNLFLSICGKDAILKLRSLMSSANSIDTPYKDIRVVIQNYISPKEKVITSEKVKFLSIKQSVGESDDDLFERLREEARYCDLEKLKTAANPEEELVIINLKVEGI